MTFRNLLKKVVAYYKELAKDQSKLAKHFVLVSIGIHLLVAIISVTQIFQFTIESPALNEWAIEAEIALDSKSEAPKDMLPRAAPAEEIMVPKQTLPQLPKTVELDKTEEEDIKETIPDEKIKESEPSEKVAKEESTPLDDKKREVAVKLKKQEALERLLKEKAREKEMFADKVSSPLSESLQRRKAQLASGQVSSGEEVNSYVVQIQRSVRRFYSIPETYRIRGDSLTARIKISVSPKGDILFMDVENSSGETGFDQLVMEIIRKAEPLPSPPKELIGKQLLLSFNP